MKCFCGRGCQQTLAWCCLSAKSWVDGCPEHGHSAVEHDHGQRSGRCARSIDARKPIPKNIFRLCKWLMCIVWEQLEFHLYHVAPNVCVEMMRNNNGRRKRSTHKSTMEFGNRKGASGALRIHFHRGKPILSDPIWLAWSLRSYFLSKWDMCWKKYLFDIPGLYLSDLGNLETFCARVVYIFARAAPAMTFVETSSVSQSMN